MAKARRETRSQVRLVASPSFGAPAGDMDLDPAPPLSAHLDSLDSLTDGALMMRLYRFQRERKVVTRDLFLDFCAANQLDLDMFLARMETISDDTFGTGFLADIAKKPMDFQNIPDPHALREARLDGVDETAKTMLDICQGSLPAFLQLTSLAEQLPRGTLDRAAALRFPHREAPHLPVEMSAAGANTAASNLSTVSQALPTASTAITKESVALLESVRFAMEVDPKLRAKLQSNPNLVQQCLMGSKDALKSLHSYLKRPLVCRAVLTNHLLGFRHHSCFSDARAFQPEWMDSEYGFRSTDTSVFALADRKIVPHDLLLDMVQLRLVTHAVTPMLVTVTEDLRSIEFIGFSLPTRKQLNNLKARARPQNASARDKKLFVVYKKLIGIAAEFHDKPTFLQQFKVRLDYFCLFLLYETFGVAAAQRIECLKSAFGWKPSDNYCFIELHKGGWICLVPDKTDMKLFGGPICPPWYDELVCFMTMLAIHPSREMHLAMARGMDGRPSTYLTRNAETREKFGSLGDWVPGATLFSNKTVVRDDKIRIHYVTKAIQGRLVPGDFAVKSVTYDLTVEGDKARAIHEFDVRVAVLCLELGVQPRSEMRPCSSDEYVEVYQEQVGKVMRVCQAIVRGKAESLRLCWTAKEDAMEE